MEKKQIPKELFKPLERKEDTSEVISRESRTFGQNARRTLFKNIPAMVALVILLLITFMSIFGPGMNEYGYDDQDVTRSNMPPRIPVLENISWLGFDGTLTEEI